MTRLLDSLMESLVSFRTVGSMLFCLFVTFSLASQCLATEHLRAYDPLGLHNGRVKRQVSIGTAPAILEDTNNDVDLYDVSKLVPNATYVITSNSVEADIFYITDQAKLRLKKDLSDDSRSLYFDYEKHKTINVFINATSKSDPSDVTLVRVTLELSDVNDESPVFTNNPSPFYAVLSENPEPGKIVYTVTATDPDTNPSLSMEIDKAQVDPAQFKDTFDLRIDSKGKTVVGIIEVVGRPNLRADTIINIPVRVIDQNAVNGDDQTTVTNVQVKVGLRNPQIYKSIYYGHFYETITANSKVVLTKQNTPLQVQVLAFQNGQLTYELLDGNNEASQWFEFLQSNRQITNKKIINFESSDERSFELTIRVNETFSTASGFRTLTSTSKLEISITDENDNSPQFTQSTYIQTVPENLAPGSSVLEVTASDQDDGNNGKIEFSLADHNYPYFSISTSERNSSTDRVVQYVGTIRVKTPLDFDEEPGPDYKFQVIATDKGLNNKTGYSQVLVSVTNVNDNPPFIDNSSSPIALQETVQSGFIVWVVDVSDKDGDDTILTLASSPSGIFALDRESGQVTTVGAVPPNKDSYTLVIKAEDTGSCCTHVVPRIRLTSEATFVINIMDVNRNKPEFTNCGTYNNQAEIKEKSPIGELVFKVTATDADRGVNKIVEYYIIEPDPNTSGAPFQIDRDSGQITVQNPFGRPADNYIQVTVKGKNPNDVPLMEGFCTFRIRIIDINDHPPRFDQETFKVTVPVKSTINTIIRRMVATDEDIGVNANITYSISDSSNKAQVFNINSMTGVLFTQRDLSPDTSQYNLIIIANDNGVDGGSRTGTATVIVTVNMEGSIKPSWVETNTNISMASNVSYYVKETAQSSTVIATLQCNSNKENNPPVDFLVYSTTSDISKSSEYFKYTQFESNGNHMMNLIVGQGQLNYLKMKTHSIYIVCRNPGMDGDLTRLEATIFVTDENNEPPYFTGFTGCCYEGSISENATAGTEVITVIANDKDTTESYRTISFKIKGDDNQYFRIEDNGENRAKIVITEALARVLDREKTPNYEILVIAEDGAPAAYPLDNPNNPPNQADRSVKVSVTDVNDNWPYFKQPKYNCDASESLLVSEEVCTVLAQDEDELDQVNGLTYIFTQGNERNYFSTSRSGQIRLNKLLDYESNEPKTFTLTLQARDGVGHTNSTQVVITVIDENDNTPVFDQNEYIVENKFDEETDTITPSNKLRLTTVRATDGDKDRTQTQILYSLSGYLTSGPDKKFEIDPTSGEIFLIGSLDREDPNNMSPTFIINAIAEDEKINPNKGYTTVKVTPNDKNDNKPTFDPKSIKGNVKEHAEKGSYVMSVLALDPDAGENGTVYYEIIMGSSQYSDFFSINRGTGQVSTNTDPKNIDREKTEFMTFVVKAFDGGNPVMSDTATITVTLIDVNDQSPYFPELVYRQTMSEHTTSGEILRVKAIDNDSDPKNKKLRYSIVDQQNLPFGVTNSDNTAAINVTKPVDYEDPNQRKFTFTLKVTDGEDGHDNTTQIVITVTDFNDNAPVFNVTEIETTIIEESDAGPIGVDFFATDKDSGINQEFTFLVVRESDPKFEFYIDDVINPDTGKVFSGKVYTRKPLDRDCPGCETREIIIMCKDKGYPPKNSTAKLKVTVSDINDNAPEFAEDYQPQVQENEPYSNYVVVEVSAKDIDGPDNSDPFNFSLPAGCSDLACQIFSLQYNRNGDGQKGSATITTSRTFDREEKKQYFLPIVISDRFEKNGGSLTATNTLTITVADINDNRHGPGHQDIFVYSYEDKFGDIIIGRVYAQDMDDWDLPDKSFTFATPVIMQNYFTLNSLTGEITMKKGVPPSPERSPYRFTVDVTDRVFKNTERCSIAVTVADLSDEAVRKSGAIRLSGITADEFIYTPTTPGAMSKYDKFKQQIAELLDYNPTGDNVQITSMSEGPGYLDVLYAAHSSPYLKASQLESVVMLNRPKFEQALGVTVKQSPINLCMEEVYDTGCYTFSNVTGQPVTINANGTSFVGAEVLISAEVGCIDRMFPEPQICRGDYCFNGGTCNQDDWGKLTCLCLEGFDGPRCQQRRHNFDGSSVAFYKALSVCAEGTTSFEFITLNKNSILMFSGPISDTDLTKDYLIIQLLDAGEPSFRLNLGAGELKLVIPGLNLADGKWHKIDIDRQSQEIQLTVDNCKEAINNNTGFVEDWSKCRATGRVPGGDVLLNVASFLQLGGRWHENNSPSYPTSVEPSGGFNGCIKNLMHDTKLYDLYYRNIPALKTGKNGCPKEEGICGEDTNSPKCGKRATCVSEWLPQEVVVGCFCHPGYHGDKCNEESKVIDLKEQSFLKWKIQPNLVTESERSSSVELMLRTRETKGNIFTMTNDVMQTIILQLQDGKVEVVFNMGEGSQTVPKTVALSYIPANNGQWHSLQLHRYGNKFVISMDGGEGRKLNYNLLEEDIKVTFQPLPYISIGARVSPVSDNANSKDISDDLIESCVKDVRINNKWLPMTQEQNTQTSSYAQLLQSYHTLDNCTRNDCIPDPCLDGVCTPLWGIHECRCGMGPDGPILTNTSGLCPALCIPNPCWNGAPCTEDENGFVCVCPVGWYGTMCNLMRQEETADAGLGAGVIIGIVATILILLILITLIIVWLVCRAKPENEKLVIVDPDDDFIRENVIFYDEEGAGEEDHQGYDMTLLTKAPFVPTLTFDKHAETGAPPRDDGVDHRPDVGSFINKRIEDAESPDDDPFNDSTHEFNFEGGDSEAGSLSSLASSSTDASQDYDYLRGWGDKFARLADMYGAGEDLGD